MWPLRIQCGHRLLFRNGKPIFSIDFPGVFLRKPRLSPTTFYHTSRSFHHTLVKPTILTISTLRLFGGGTNDKTLLVLLWDAAGMLWNMQTGSAISDLLALSRSKFLIGTGSSTFSAWAAYLGQMPAMTRLGNPFSWFNLKNREGRFIGEWDANRPNADHRLTLER